MGRFIQYLKKRHAEGGCPFRQSTRRCFGTEPKEVKKADREAELMELAHELVDEVGFAGLTMDKLVAKAPYSKGTVYNHFTSKEDLISALSANSIGMKIELMKKAMAYPGKTREKGLALVFAYNLYARLEPTLFNCVMSAKTPAVIEKTSIERQNRMQEREHQITSMCDQFFQNAVAQGELKLSPGVGVEALSFASWATAFGTNLLLINASAAEAVSRLEFKYALLGNMNMLYDGMGWQPLSSEFDYFKTWEQLEDYFSDYIEMLND